MRAVLAALIMFSMQAAFALDVSITRKSPYKVAVDGVMLPDNFTAPNTAEARAIQEAARCACPVRLYQPEFEVLVTGLQVVEVPDEPQEPAPVTAYSARYSYSLLPSGALLDPKPLAGATLTQRSFYVDFTVPDGVTPDRLRAYCCKVRNGASESAAVLAEHTTNTNFTAAPYVWQVNLADSTNGHRELWFAAHIGAEQAQTFTFFQTVFATEQVALSWDAPTMRENGAALPASEIAGYTLVIKRGDAVAVAIDTSETEYRAELPAGDYVAAVSATDRAGLASRPSNSVNF